MVSFFSLSLSCLNAGARIIFPLSGHGFLPKRAHVVHHKNMTPHVALASYGTVILLVAGIFNLTGTSPSTLFGDAGTMAAFGFLSAYFPDHDRRAVLPAQARRAEASQRGCCDCGVPVSAGATVGSFYPAPPYPVNLFPTCSSRSCCSAAHASTRCTAPSRRRCRRYSATSNGRWPPRRTRSPSRRSCTRRSRTPRITGAPAGAPPASRHPPRTNGRRDGLGERPERVI